MRLLRNLRRIRELMAADVNAHLGDIAILKMDSAAMAPRPEHAASIGALEGYAPPFDLEALARLPVGTFGRRVADFMEAERLSPFRITDAIDPEMRRRNALGIRIAQTHDLIHVLAGFDTSWPGEMGVYAIQVAQRWSVWSPLLGAATWVFYPFLTGFRIGALRAAWQRGLAIGRAAPFLLGERLEEHFEEPLEALRARYGFEGVS